MLKYFNRNKNLLLFITILLVILSGCGHVQEITEIEPLGNPTPQDFLDKENADIFVFDNIVYSNASDINWVKELDYTIGEEIGEITKQSNKSSEFENGTSNKLPVGTKIYATDTQIYIAIVDGKEIPYLKMIEG